MSECCRREWCPKKKDHKRSCLYDDQWTKEELEQFRDDNAKPMEFNRIHHRQCQCQKCLAMRMAAAVISINVIANKDQGDGDE